MFTVLGSDWWVDGEQWSSLGQPAWKRRRLFSADWSRQAIQASFMGSKQADYKPAGVA